MPWQAQFRLALADINHKMLFGKKDKKPSDRVLDLKARVDALRAADEATRKKAYTLDHFLEGDDVLTGRSLEDEYTPQGFDASNSNDTGGPVSSPSPDTHFEVNLQAELDKYLQRQAELEGGAAGGAPSAAPSQQPRAEPGSFSFDDIGGRDGDPLRPPPESLSDSAKTWSTDATDWSAPGSAPAASPTPAMDDPSTPAWPSLSEWPSEDDWPPREKAV
jgi:hypothetical protein